MKPVPGRLLSGLFTREDALAAGVTPRMLDGSRFVRVSPRVWRHRDHQMTRADWWQAAALTLPPAARTTGITRLQQLGLDFGPRLPLRFVIAGDLHLDIDGIFLHRTKLMPPGGEAGVCVEAAFMAYCAREVLYVLDHLNPEARSLKESELRAILEAAGLPRPEVNVAVAGAGSIGFTVDLWYAAWRVAVEYEGSHHQEDRAQYSSDIDRYAVIRRLDVRYVQVTKEKLGRPHALVGEVFRELVANGYAEPPLTFGPRWEQLFQRLTRVVGHRADVRWVSHRFCRANGG